MESVRPVHKPSIEITPDEDVQWEPLRPDMYTGPTGGGKPGPTHWMQEVVRNAATLACIFPAMVPWGFFLMVAERSHQ